MPLLDREGARVDRFTRIPGAEAGSVTGALVPLSEIDAAWTAADSNRELGVEIANTTRLDALIPHLPKLALVAIIFPAFSDGRGFSLARQIRSAGFQGTLRLVGPLIADQFAYALACGFNEIELPETSAERQPEAQWQAALGARSVAYQRGYQQGRNILDQRRAARLVGGQDV